MKLNLTVVLALSAATMVAQTTLPQMNEPQNAVIEFNGGKYNGYVMEFNAPPDIVEEEVKTHFKPQKVKPKKVNDYMVYRNVVLPQVDAEKKMDAFIKVEKKSKKEENRTVAYLIVTNAGEIPDKKVKSDDTAMAIGVTAVAGSAVVLRGLTPNVEQKNYEKNMAAQQSALKKEEDKLAGLKKDQADMEKKIKQLQSDLEKNAKEQTKQTAAVNKAKNASDDLLSKKPGGPAKN